MKTVSYLIFVLILSACINPQAIKQYSGSQGWYQVHAGDTLYSIAWRYGLDYKALADWNNIDVDSTIFPGQQLQLIQPVEGDAEITADSVADSTGQQSGSVSVIKNQSISNTQELTTKSSNPQTWLWPTEGEVLSTFSAKQLDRRGIDIAGKTGQSVQAVADGKVVYSGNGLAGYGNLIIIKHSDIFLSAYAYSRERLVKEGVTVKAGHVIAKMGKHKSRTARLHFQIRKNGKPVDPLQFLPKR